MAGTINRLLQLKPIPQWVLNRVSKTTTLRVKLAQHQTTPVDYLELLSIDGCEVVRCSVASCLNLLNISPSYLATLAQDPSKRVQINLAKNTSTLASCLEILTQDNESEVLWWVARNRNTPAHCLKIILHQNSENDEIIEGLVMNRNSSADLLSIIYNRCHDSRICRYLADNKRTPQCILEALFCDPDASIRKCVASNPSTSKTIKYNLMEDIDRNVAFVAWANLNKIYSL
jgi:hypothetical protein